MLLAPDYAAIVERLNTGEGEYRLERQSCMQPDTADLSSLATQ